MGFDGDAFETGSRRRGRHGDCLPEALQGTRRIAQVRQERAALHVADSEVRGRKLLTQLRDRKDSPGRGGPDIERRLDDELAGRSGAGNRRQGIVDVEHYGVRELPQILEAAARDVRLPRADRDPCDEARGCERGQCGREPIPPDEFPGAVGNRVRSRPNGQAGAITLDIVGKLLRRRVSPVRVLGDGARQDGIEIAAQPARSMGGSPAARLAERIGRQHRVENLVRVWFDRSWYGKLPVRSS